mmetsp:Transcript_9910/g.15623  ORF Transcript_9910/g.15623 Transcript_9910/m.15623 type:complete len:232 (+) Transcript_9910:64-759(+)
MLLIIIVYCPVRLLFMFCNKAVKVVNGFCKFLGALLLILTVADVNGALLLLAGADDQDVVVLGELALADFLGQRLRGGVHLAVEPGRLDLLLDVVGVVEEGVAHGHHQRLPRGQPERPLPAEVLGEDGDHALDAAQHRAVHHHRPLPPRAQLPPRGGARAAGRLGLPRVVGGLVAQVEPDGQLEVQLHRGALVHPLHRVVHLDVNFRAIEGTVGRVDFPVANTSKVIQRGR